MKIKPGFMLREVAGCSVVVAIGADTMNFNGMINLNETGTFLWRLLEKGATIEELVDSTLAEYDIDKETANRDIFLFLNKMREAELIDE